MTYNEKTRLAEIISDARKLLARKPSESPANLAVLCGELEATLKMLADSAEIVASPALTAAEAETLADYEQAGQATVTRIMGEARP